MVRTEIDMIFDLSPYQPPYQPPLHRPLPHHPQSRYHLQHPQFTEFYYEEKSPIYQYNDCEEDRIVYETRRGFANPNPHRRGEFSNPNRRNMFPYSIRDQKGGYSNLDEFSNFIPSFDESPNVGLTLL